MTIPTIELRATGVPVPGSPYNSDTFDLYENGVLMTHGRTFQCPMMMFGAATDPHTSAIGVVDPMNRVMNRLYVTNVLNASLTYIRDGSLTNFAFTSHAIGGFPFFEDVQASYNGKFINNETGGFIFIGAKITCALPMASIPVFMVAANASVLEDWASDVYAPWSMTLSGTSSLGFIDATTICPRPYFNPPAYSVLCDERSSLVGRADKAGYPYDYPYINDGFCPPVCYRQFVNSALGRSFNGDYIYTVGPPSTDVYADLRCYRTASSHATLDWPGAWPTLLT